MLWWQKGCSCWRIFWTSNQARWWTERWSWSHCSALHQKLQAFWLLQMKIVSSDVIQNWMSFERVVRSKIFDLILSCAKMNDDSVQSHRCISASCCLCCCQQQAAHVVEREQNKCVVVGSSQHVLCSSCTQLWRIEANCRLSAYDVAPSFWALLLKAFVFQRRKAWEWMTLWLLSSVRAFHMGELHHHEISNMFFCSLSSL